MNGTLVAMGVCAIVLIALIIFLCMIYRVADVDKALIVTGGKKPIVKVSGGSFVIPIFRKAQYFDLCMLTVTADRDEVKTNTAVPIIIDWTAQIRPDTSDVDGKLMKAIMSFKERGKEGIINDVRLTLTGAVRDIVASMTPAEVLRDKQVFTEKVKQIVSDEMANMGMELVSLNIQDISDKNGYYDNMAAPDMEAKRQSAEVTKAQVDQAIRQQKAVSEKEAQQAELASQLEVAEKKKDNDLKLAEFKTKTDTANADAEIAGELQKTKRLQDVATEQGNIKVVEQEQANKAAEKEKEVIATRAEAEKQKKRIEAEADADVRTIAADAQVSVAERNAHAIKIAADAQAEKVLKEGTAEADVVRKKGIAEAEIKKAQGLADADVDRAKRMAEADGTKAQLMAQAEGERALAEARASNDKVNFEIEKLKIEAQARIEVATKTATIMAELGKNAQFVNLGGSAQGQGATGNVLLDTLRGIPELMKVLDVENQALNGKPINNEIEGLISSIATPLKGILSGATSESNTEAADVDKTDAIEPIASESNAGEIAVNESGVDSMADDSTENK